MKIKEIQDDNVYWKAIDAAQKVHPEKTPGMLRDLELISAFLWDDTTEKHDYWNSINQQTPVTLTNMKTIIGYNLKSWVDPEVAAKTLDTHVGPTTGGVWLPTGGGVYQKAVEMKLLDLWFDPVYEADFKKGDWIVKTFEGGNKHMFQYTETRNKTFYCIPGTYRTSDGQSVGSDCAGSTGIKNMTVRKATKAEIEEYRKKYWKEGTWLYQSEFSVLLQVDYKTEDKLFYTSRYELNNGTWKQSRINDFVSNGFWMDGLIPATAEQIKAADTKKEVTLVRGSRNDTIVIKGGKVLVAGAFYPLVGLKRLVATATPIDLGPYVATLDKTVRCILIGCSSENHLFSINEINSIIKTAEEQL